MMGMVQILSQIGRALASVRHEQAGRSLSLASPPLDGRLVALKALLSKFNPHLAGGAESRGVFEPIAGA